MDGFLLIVISFMSALITGFAVLEATTKQWSKLVYVAIAPTICVLTIALDHFILN